MRYDEKNCDDPVSVLAIEWADVALSAVLLDICIQSPSKSAKRKELFVTNN